MRPVRSWAARPSSSSVTFLARGLLARPQPRRHLRQRGARLGRDGERASVGQQVLRGHQRLGRSVSQQAAERRVEQPEGVVVAAQQLQGAHAAPEHVVPRPVRLVVGRIGQEVAPALQAGAAVLGWRQGQTLQQVERRAGAVGIGGRALGAQQPQQHLPARLGRQVGAGALLRQAAPRGIRARGAAHQERLHEIGGERRRPRPRRRPPAG